jgi:hypothetical protein
VSCQSQKKLDSYSSCIEQKMNGTGINFYAKMSKIESKMIEIGALKDRSKKAYVNALESLIVENDSEWQEYYSILQRTVLSEFDLESVKVQVLSYCSDVNLSEGKIEYNSFNIHKYFLKKFTYKPYDDSETLDGLLLFTDFEQKDLRLNITYLLLLNMKEKLK